MAISDPIWTRSQDLLAQAGRAKDLATILKKGFGGIMLAVSSSIVGIILSGAEVAIQPMYAMAGALADLAVAIFGSPAEIVIASATATAASLTGQFNVGPFTLMLGVGSVLGALWLIGRYRDEEETGNLVPGLPFDLPFIGESEEGES